MRRFFVMGISLFTLIVLAQDAWAGNVATRWTEQAFAAVRGGTPAIHTGTPGAARVYAMLTTAMYDAVNGIERALSVSNRAHCLVPPDGAPAGGDTSAAAAAAAHAVLSAVFPGRQTTASD